MVDQLDCLSWFEKNGVRLVDCTPCVRHEIRDSWCEAPWAAVQQPMVPGWRPRTPSASGRPGPSGAFDGCRPVL